TSGSAESDTRFINVTLPAAVDNQSKVQLRIITANAAGEDEWIGIDNIVVSAFSNAPPVLRDEQVDVLQDTAFVSGISQGVLANDTASEELSVTEGWKRTAAGGQITFAEDGTYHYVSAAGFVGTDTVQYTVVDDLDNVVGTSTLTLNVVATALRPFV